MIRNNLQQNIKAPLFLRRMKLVVIVLVAVSALLYVVLLAEITGKVAHQESMLDEIYAMEVTVADLEKEYLTLMQQIDTSVSEGSQYMIASSAQYITLEDTADFAYNSN